jgi:anti-anti-sigma factor
MIHEPISISRAFGKIVVTVHAGADAELLRQTLAALVEDQVNLDLIIDLRDAGMLDQDSISVLIGSAQHVRRAGGNLVLATPSPVVPDALEDSGFTIAQSGPGFFHDGSGAPLYSLPGP